MATIIAIGGEEVGPILENGNVKQVVSENIHKEIVTRTSKRHPKVLFIPTAKDDREDYIAGFQKYYADLGCSAVEVLRLLYQRPSKKEIVAKIFSADAIYVGGGNTHRLIQTWKRYGVDDLLKRAHQKGIVLAGHSAGAVCWFTYGCSDPFYKHQPYRLTALGLVNALLCPHYDTESFRQDALKKMMRRTPHQVAITLDDYAAIEVVDNSYRILANNSSSRANRMFWQDDKYIAEEIKPTEKFQDLKQLLTKPRKSGTGNSR